MKKKILIVMSAALVFGLAIVAYSYGTSGSTSAAAVSCCCCSGDACPMKTKDASGKETTMSCCDGDCCKGEAESCPMMKKDADGKPIKMESGACCPMMKKDGSHADIKDGASCPIVNKDASASTTMDMKHDMKGTHHDMKDMKGMHGEGCSCPCCHKQKDEKEKAATPAA